MPNLHAELVFQRLLAAGDLLLRLRGRQVPQIAMSGGMRADFMPSGKPFAHLRHIHEALGHIALSNIPFICAAEEAGHQKLDGAELMSRQGSDAMIEHVEAAVIEGDNGFTPRVTARCEDVCKRA